MRIKYFIAVFFLLFPLFIFAEKKTLKIDFIQNENFCNDISFISSEGYDRYSKIVNSLENGRKVYFTNVIPKVGIIEGEYKLSVYMGTDCLVVYNIISDNFVYNETNGYFQKVPNILNNVRAILFLEYLRGM